MDYFGILTRFPSVMHDGKHYVKYDDAKFLLSEALKDKEKEFTVMKAVVPILEWTDGDEESLNELIFLVGGIAEDTDEGPKRDKLLRLVDWMEDFQQVLTDAGFRNVKDGHRNSNSE